MKIVLTGATGFVGSALFWKLLEAGHEPVLLTRNPNKARESLGYPATAFAWDAQVQPAPPEAFEGVEAIIHLAGESIASGRWTDSTKARIRNSRVLGTRHLLEGLQKSKARPSIFLSASAIGIYGDADDTELNEASPRGKGFLADITQEWEDELHKVESLVQRAAIFRFGVILHSSGGALPKMSLPFEMGLGGPIGSGKQWLSWIHRDDLITLLIRALTQTSIAGVINAVAPAPVRQRDFALQLAQNLHTHVRLTTPAIALRAALGEAADLVLQSQRVLPTRLMDLGFSYQYPTLKSALDHLYPQAQKKGARILERRQWIPKPVEQIFPFFSDEKNLEALTPSFLNFHVIKKSTQQLGSGTLIDYRLKIHGLPIQWRSKITQWKTNESFTDLQIKGPYSLWKHSHTFTPFRGGTLMTDRVEYLAPGGPLRHVVTPWVQHDINEIFNYRRMKINEVFQQTLLNP